MKRILSALALAALLPAFVCTPAVADDDDDYRAITTCNTAITESGHYKLMNDLSGCNELSIWNYRNGITIYSDDVVLDLNGHTISCERDPTYEFLSVGVYVDYAARVRIKNGTVTGCDWGVSLDMSEKVTVKKLTLTGVGTGIEMYGGANNKIQQNRMIDNDWNGLFVTSYYVWPDWFIELGTGHKIHKNLMVGHGFPAISADGLQDTVISCNRLDRNQVGIELYSPGGGNFVRGNVANNNELYGIGATGIVIGDEPFWPMAEGNTFKRNTALGNGWMDIAEAFYDWATDSYVAVDECFNTWKKNQFGTSFGADSCFGPPAYFNDDNGCAPGYDDDDDDGDSDRDD